MTLTSIHPLHRTLSALALSALLACGGGGTTTDGASDSAASSTTGSTGAPETTVAEPSTGAPTTGGSASASASATTTGEPGDTTGASSSTSTTAVSGTTTGAGETGEPPGDTSTGEPGGSSSDTGADASTGEPGTTGAIDDCVAWQAAFEAETLEIRGCTDDAECGQELVGTSCGCTRNWVALKAADVTEFWALVDQGNALGCDLPFFSTCDCPEAEGFACEGGICTWNYL